MMLGEPGTLKENIYYFIAYLVIVIGVYEFLRYLLYDHVKAAQKRITSIWNRWRTNKKNNDRNQ